MLLAFDVGFKATGWCMFDGRMGQAAAWDGKQPQRECLGLVAVSAGVIVPTEGVSPKLLNDKRKCDAAVPQIEGLFSGFRKVLRVVQEEDKRRHDPAHPIPLYVIAEVPSMGSQNAGSAREMAMALAAFVAAIAAELPFAFTERYLRSDVIAAMYGQHPPRKPTDKKKAKGFMKRETAKVVQQRIALDLTDVPESLREHAYDAAACLFAARDAPSVRSQRWGEEAMGCLRMAR
jgi:hypothetical protein